MVRILFLSQRLPYPPNRGDKITTWRLVERMKRTHDVHCIAFAHDETICEFDADVAHEATDRQSVIMIEELQRYCPNVREACKTSRANMLAWSKDAVEVLDASGRLIPWVPKALAA